MGKQWMFWVVLYILFSFLCDHENCIMTVETATTYILPARGSQRAAAAACVGDMVDAMADRNSRVCIATWSDMKCPF